MKIRKFENESISQQMLPCVSKSAFLSLYLSALLPICQFVQKGQASVFHIFRSAIFFFCQPKCFSVASCFVCLMLTSYQLKRGHESHGQPAIWDAFSSLPLPITNLGGIIRPVRQNRTAALMQQKQCGKNNAEK